MLSPYATSEDHAKLWVEQAILASTHVGAIAFGILIAIYYLTLYYGLKQKKTSWRWVIFNTTLVIMGTVSLATSIHFNQTAWIDERNYPGGPFAFLMQQQNGAVQAVGNSASVVAATMTEGLLLYRVFIVWRRRWYIVALPALSYLVCTALSIVAVIQIQLPLSPTWTKAPNFAFPAWMAWLVLNVVLTMLLAVRLLYMRHKLRSVMGDQYGRVYTNVAAMAVESALPFGILCIVYLVLFGSNDPAQNLFLPLLVQVECISPLLIILRVIRGRAWAENTVPPAQPSTLHFVAARLSSTSDGVQSGSLTRANDLSENTFRHRSDSDLDQKARSKENNV